MDATFDDGATEREFRDRGYVVRPFLGAGEVEAVQRLHDRLHPVIAGDFVATTLHTSFDFRWAVSQGIREIVEPRLLELLPRHKVALATFVAKPARTTRGHVPLHQDWWIVDNRVERGLSVWVPLVDVGADNGCLKVVPGAHDLLNDPFPLHPRFRMPYNARQAVLEEELAERLAAKAGAAVVYDQRMLHGSGDNLTGQPRVAFNCLMIPADSEPRLYAWDPDVPAKMDVFAVDERFLCAFPYPLLLSEPYPAGVRPLETIDAAYRPFDDSDVDRLRARQAELTESEHAAR